MMNSRRERRSASENSVIPASAARHLAPSRFRPGLRLSLPRTSSVSRAMATVKAMLLAWLAEWSLAEVPENVAVSPRSRDEKP